MTRLIDADALCEQITKKEELARQRVLDTPLRMPNGDFNPSVMRYATQLDERTRMKFMIVDAPTVETEVSLIHCEECKYVGRDTSMCLVCDREGMGLRPFHVHPYDYCSYAEPKESYG